MNWPEVGAIVAVASFISLILGKAMGGASEIRGLKDAQETMQKALEEAASEVKAMRTRLDIEQGRREAEEKYRKGS